MEKNLCTTLKGWGRQYWVKGGEGATVVEGAVLRKKGGFNSG